MPPLERFLFTLNRQDCILFGKFFGLLGIRRSTFLEKVYDLPGIRERNGIGVELHSFEKALGSLVQRKFFFTSNRQDCVTLFLELTGTFYVYSE